MTSRTRRGPGGCRHEPDFAQFRKALTRSGRPDHLPFYEHIASPEFVARRTGRPFARMTMDDAAYWPTVVEFWLGLGFDCVPMEVPLDCPLGDARSGAGESFESEARTVIRSWADFERYPWPAPERPLAFRHFETVARLLPPGAKIVGGVCMGPYEWVSQMMGVMGLAYAIHEQPDLVEAMFRRIGDLIIGANRQLAGLDSIGALRQGDDLGFKTSTFLAPDLLRQHVFPTYREMVRIAHAAGKPFILHSCGNLDAVYPDLIDDVGIDAKHSFEETILPVEQFKRRYGHRVTPLGGLDVDLVCRGTEAEIRRAAREKIEQCYAEDGWYALGTGNSLTDYMPVENYLMALDEGRKVAGAA
jgi:uroporphyrinogen decarboxylase